MVPVTSTSEAIALLERSTSWAALLIDVSLPDGSGLDVLEHARKVGCESPALVLSASYDPENINRAFDLGAKYTVKPFDPQRITAFLRDLTFVREGQFAGSALGWSKRYSLTRTETSILEAAVEGMTYRDMLEQRGIVRGTLKKHVQNILRKTGDQSLLAAVARLLRERLDAS